MAEPLAEYTVRDYSAVDAQVAQIAERERILTNKLKLANVKQALILAAGGLLAVGVFLLWLAKRLVIDRGDGRIFMFQFDFYLT